MAHLLLGAGAAVDAANVAGAASKGQTAAVRVLLDAHAAVNAAATQGWTALHQAAQNDHAAVAQQLLDAQGNVNAATEFCNTSMYYAAAGGHSKTVRLLLAAPQLTTEAFAGAAAAAAAAGHMELAIMVLEALCARDSPATVAAELQEPALGLGVLGQWEASESAVQEEEARWPAFQEFVIGVAGVTAVHQQVQEAAGNTTSCIEYGTLRSKRRRGG